MGTKGQRYSPRLRFQVVPEVLSGERDAVEIARARNLHPKAVLRREHELLANGPSVFGRDTTIAAYEKEITEMERLFGRTEVKLTLLQGLVGGSS